MGLAHIVQHQQAGRALASISANWSAHVQIFRQLQAEAQMLGQPLLHGQWRVGATLSQITPPAPALQCCRNGQLGLANAANAARSPIRPHCRRSAWCECVAPGGGQLGPGRTRSRNARGDGLGGGAGTLTKLPEP
ncbi:MAG: hypothetical protein R2911_07270 [Caldilineaceae bacterium]